MPAVAASPPKMASSDFLKRRNSANDKGGRTNTESGPSLAARPVAMAGAVEDKAPTNRALGQACARSVISFRQSLT